MLTEKAINEIEEQGLVVFGKHRDVVMVSKPLTTSGNCIEGKVSTPICELEMIDGELLPKDPPFETDAPVLSILSENNEYAVEVWQWVPGPGPGDFHIAVSSESEAIAFVKHYFFEDNEHFLAYKKHCEENPNHS